MANEYTEFVLNLTASWNTQNVIVSKYLATNDDAHLDEFYDSIP